ncbi:hypothetical protein F5X96DRAFT_243768 [Biscogniauxia mediterranea]|nr:hypothetical protein F5X96DRAFT_243768 [Biscogniauxia mediterranea]
MACMCVSTLLLLVWVYRVALAIAYPIIPATYLCLCYYLSASFCCHFFFLFFPSRALLSLSPPPLVPYEPNKDCGTPGFWGFRCVLKHQKLWFSTHTQEPDHPNASR